MRGAANIARTRSSCRLGRTRGGACPPRPHAAGRRPPRPPPSWRAAPQSHAAARRRRQQAFGPAAHPGRERRHRLRGRTQRTQRPRTGRTDRRRCQPWGSAVARCTGAEWSGRQSRLLGRPAGLLATATGPMLPGQREPVPSRSGCVIMPGCVIRPRHHAKLSDK